MYIDSITFIIRLSISREDRIFSRKDILCCPESLTPFLMPVYLSVFPRRHSVNAMKSFIKPGRAAVSHLNCECIYRGSADIPLNVISDRINQPAPYAVLLISILPESAASTALAGSS